MDWIEDIIMLSKVRHKERDIYTWSFFHVYDLKIQIEVATTVQNQYYWRTDPHNSFVRWEGRDVWGIAYTVDESRFGKTCMKNS